MSKQEFIGYSDKSCIGKKEERSKAVSRSASLREKRNLQCNS